MGIFPWDDWFYNLPWLRDQVNSRHDLLVQTQDNVQTDVGAFNKLLGNAKLLIANNALLLYISTTIQMDDLQLRDFQTQIDQLPDPVKGDIVLNSLEAGSEAIGGILALKFVVNLGQLAKKVIFGTGETATVQTEKVVVSLGEDALDAGITNVTEAATTESLENAAEAGAEEITEVVVEDSTSAALATTGLGIFLAVGLDAIFGAINGAEEQSKLEDILKKLDDKMIIVNKFLDTVRGRATDLDTKTINGISTFQAIASEMERLLPVGHKPTFQVDFPATLDSLDTCLDNQQKALVEFKLLVNLRNKYVDALNRNPNVTKDAVVNAVLFDSPTWVTYELLDSIWTEVLAKYSDMMKNAK
jgi:flagellar hook-basal body complex protein FliE